MDSSSASPSRVMWLLLGAVIAGVPCFIAGGVVGNLQVYHSILEDETEAANKIISLTPEFAGIQLAHHSQGTVMLQGTVETQEAYAKLKALVIEQFGSRWLDKRMRDVKIANPQNAIQ